MACTQKMSDDVANLLKWQKKLIDTVSYDLKLRLTDPESAKRGTFIVGPPGTGKSYGVNALVSKMKKDYPALRIEVAATTGAAASRLINAKTLASWMSIGKDAMKLHLEDEITKIVMARMPERPLDTDVLICDEVSMLSDRHFHVLSKLLGKLRDNPVAFGGIYVIFVGDPFQLPPVPHDSGGGQLRKQKEFVESCLESQKDGYNYVVADEMIRAKGCSVLKKILLMLIQPDDSVREEALSLLNEHCFKRTLETEEVLDLQEKKGSLVLSTAREGEFSVAEYNACARRRAQKNPANKIITIPGPTQLHDDSDEILESIGGSLGLHCEVECIKERDAWSKDENIYIGTPCMNRMNFTTKEGEKITNGDMGKLVGIDPDTGAVLLHIYRLNKLISIPRCKITSEWEEKIGFEACPILPASAITVHKAQGATIPGGIIFESRRIYVGEYLGHMLYTALSRATKIQDIRVTNYMLQGLLSTPDIRKKLSYIWKLPYMKGYLTPDKVA
jgi:ATP-dependent exoDNAse (exonuclease V) alpha subunit